MEIRRNFQLPPTSTSSVPLGGKPLLIQAPSSSPNLLNSFMWNDRDCNAKNFFICEKPLYEELSPGQGEDQEENQHLLMGRTEGKRALFSFSWDLIDLVFLTLSPQTRRSQTLDSG